MRERWARAVPAIEVGANEAERLIAPAFPGAKVLQVELVAGGLSNTNLKLGLDRAPGAVLLRLWQRDPSQAKKEAALARLMEDRVPVARFHHSGERDGVPFAVLDWIEGERLERVAASLEAAEREALAREIWRVLAAIHSVTFDRAGFLDGELKVVPFPAFVLSGFLRACLIDGAGARHIDSVLAARVVEYARKNDALLDAWNAPPRLVHFDFGGSNILVREEVGTWKVAAVLDWEFAASASPAADFGNLLRAPLGTLPGFADGVAQGYRGDGGFMPNEWEKAVRLSDLGAWAEFLTRPNIGAKVIEDAVRVFEMTLGLAGPTP